MSLANTRESLSLMILLDFSSWTPWLQQLETRSVLLNVWELIAPTATKIARIEPTFSSQPSITKYEGRASLGVDDDGERLLPENPSDLTQNGIKAWKDDVEYYKMLLEEYKNKDKKYQEERASLDKIVVYIQQTVSPHLMKNCCKPGQPIRTWLATLRDTVGIDAEEERERARDRYLAALKPMRQASSWDTWLTEYNHAATTAETEGVSEVQNLVDITRDFLRAILKVAPTWEISFKEHGRREKNMTRKEMMKRFREHMSEHHPVKGKYRGGAFVTGDASFLAAGGESTPGTDRDASHAAEDAPSNPTIRGGRGRPRQKRTLGQGARSKQSLTEDTAAAEGVKCPACEQRHRLEDCYYVYPGKAPQWFTPRAGVTAMVNYRLEHDTDVQEQLRGQKRARTRTPIIKQSQSYTPEAPSIE
jgi:hypothetical protein